jgi:DNA-binding NarL/FixJ family response regulator
MTRTFRIVLADDHLLLRQGLKRILAERTDLEVTGEAGDGVELLAVLKTVCPDVVVLDISMPKLRGIEAIPEVKKLCPTAKIIVHTMHKDQDYLAQSIHVGADGYLLKEDVEDELLNAIDRVLQGGVVSPFLHRQLSGSLIDEFRRRKAGPLRIRCRREREKFSNSSRKANPAGKSAPCCASVSGQWSGAAQI